jgi:hypothetical protein
MAPTVVGDGSYRLFFFSREEPRIHIPLAHPHGDTKFWLQPSLTLANHTGLSRQELADAERIVARHLQEIIDAWHEHFSG